MVLPWRPYLMVWLSFLETFALAVTLKTLPFFVVVAAEAILLIFPLMEI